ncbi:MAG TPA: FkbM family methyltransferase [Terriglobia bacterium]|nr:FkbM family methyltransferase [Terriglobia bacterium]
MHYPDFRNFLLAYREIFVRHSYAFKSTRSNPRIFDCGANIGLATLFFKSWYPESSVLCFEPDPSAYAALRLNVERNGLKDVRHFNLALWDSDGEIDFYITPDRAGNVRNSAVAGRVNGDTIHVPAKRLSSFIGDERVDLLKLDVEGAEQRVLCDLSASGKLSQVDAIFVEYHHRIADNSAQLSEFLSILERAGFEYHLDCRWRPGYTGSQSQDVLIYAARW